MKSTAQNKRSKGKRIWIIVLAVLVVVAGGLAGATFLTNKTSLVSGTTSATADYNTTRVKEGSLTLSVSASGTLVPGKERALFFSVDGIVASVDVQVGEEVKEGQVLASLTDLEDLEAEVNGAEQDLIDAQEAVEVLKDNSAVNLANARIALSDAQDALSDAKSGLVKEGWARCDQETTEAYYYKYIHAKEALEALGDGGGSADYYLTSIVPAKNTVASALAAYENCAGYTEYEIASSEATLSLAEANLAQAEEDLTTLTENGGVDPLDLATAENKVKNAQLSLDKAKEKLAGATLTAPFDGTILSIAGEPGDEVEGGSFITIADLAHPQVEFSADETDMDMISVGELANISFDAVPDRVFTGSVIRINPELESSGGYQVITGVIEMDLTNETEELSLPKGLNATVELVNATAENVMLVSVQALRDLGDGSYALFVVGEDGEPKMRVVEVGIMDAATAEIKSGVSIGDVVTTGIVETK